MTPQPGPTRGPSPGSSPSADVQVIASAPPPNHPVTATELTDLQQHWPDVLGLLTASLGPATTSILSRARPVRIANGILTLEFEASAKIQKQMAESDGRAEQIRSALSKHLGQDLRLALQIATPAGPPGDQAVQGTPEEAQTVKQKRHDLLNDPAVKTVLLGLNATITGIEEP